MRVTVVLVHIGESLVPVYQEAFGPEATIHRVERGALSGAYGPDGLAGEYPTLLHFLGSQAPEWKPGVPVVVIAFSAGVAAPRAWLRDRRSREAASAVMLLDGLHSSEARGGGCRPDQVDGVLAFAELAERMPASHLLIVTHTDIDPGSYASTTECAALVKPYADGSVVVERYRGSTAADHLEQQRSVGPELVESVVVPWLAGEYERIPLWFAVTFGVTVVGVLGFMIYGLLRPGPGTRYRARALGYQVELPLG